MRRTRSASSVHRIIRLIIVASISSRSNASLVRNNTGISRAGTRETCISASITTRAMMLRDYLRFIASNIRAGVSGSWGLVAL